MIEVTREDILRGLSSFNIKKNAVILVHSSLKSFGHVKGGAEAVIEAITGIAGEGGTVLMPTLTFGSVNEREPFFDAAKTPSGTGYITEVFRKMPGTRRSLHLFSSAAARGKKADHMTSFHDTTPCSPESPYGKVISEGGYVLFLGAGFGSNTLFHVAEEHVNPPYMRYKTIGDARIVDMEGRIHIRDMTRYDCYQTGISRKLELMEPVFEKSGVLKRTRIGNCNVTLIGAEDNFNISCDVLRENYKYILGE